MKLRWAIRFSCLLAVLTWELQAQEPAVTLPDLPEAYTLSLQSAGELLVFQRIKAGDTGLYWSRQMKEGAWSAYSPLFSGADSAVFWGGPTFRSGTNELLLFGNAPEVPDARPQFDIFTCQYQEASGEWTGPERLPSPINSADYEAFPTMSADGQQLLFVRLPKAGQSDTLGFAATQDRQCFQIMWSQKLRNGQWGEPQPWSVVDGACAGFPRFMPDGETVLFSRLNEAGGTGFDLYYSRWDGQAWSAAAAVEGATTNRDDILPTVLFDGNPMHWTQTGTMRFGSVNPQLTTRTVVAPELGGWVPIRGQVTDSAGTPLAAKIEIREANSERLLETLTLDTHGDYQHRLRAGKNYLLTVSAPEYSFASFTLLLADRRNGQPIERDVALASLATTTTIALDDLNFRYNSDEISDSAAAILAVAATLLLDNPEVRVEIAAHTDDVGSEDFNQTLSDSRAQAVLDALVAKGIDPKRLVAKGYGERQPLADNATEAGRARNRRVEFRILEP